jgi:hypothetical protein
MKGIQSAPNVVQHGGAAVLGFADNKNRLKCGLMKMLPKLAAAALSVQPSS